MQVFTDISLLNSVNQIYNPMPCMVHIKKWEASWLPHLLLEVVNISIQTHLYLSNGVTNLFERAKLL